MQTASTWPPKRATMLGAEPSKGTLFKSVPVSPSNFLSISASEDPGPEYAIETAFSSFAAETTITPGSDTIFAIGAKSVNSYLHPSL